MNSAVRGTPSRGTADCVSYFLTAEVLPATTITYTSTIPEIAATTVYQTVTTTVYSIATDIQQLTATNVVEVTASTTLEATATYLSDATATAVLGAVLTATTSSTLTTILDVTATEDVDVTAIYTSLETIVDVIGTVATTVVDIVLTQTNTATATITATSLATLLDRRAITSASGSTTTIIPSFIPLYASSCSGSVRYSSACSCIGVTPRTTILAPSSTTVTSPITSTISTITQTVTQSTAVAEVIQSTVLVLETVTTVNYYTTDSTAVVTITDSTDVITSVVSTETDYTTISTMEAVVVESTATILITGSTETDFVTVTTEILVVPAATSTVLTTTETATSLYTFSTYELTATLATATETVIETVTPTCANPQPTFALQVVGGVYQNKYLQNAPTDPANCGDAGTGSELCDAVRTSSSITAASIYTLDGTVLSDFNGFALATYDSPDYVSAFFFPPADISSNEQHTETCRISGGQLHCSSQASTIAEFCGAQLIFADSTAYDPAGLDSDFKYDALSYAWGKNVFDTAIMMRGHRCKVTEYLHTALRYFRHPDKPRSIWIDSLCINQNDKSEKSEQVKKMSDMYSNTDLLTVWLGEAEDDSDFGMDMIREVGNYLHRNDSWMKDAHFPRSSPNASQRSRWEIQGPSPNIIQKCRWNHHHEARDSYQQDPGSIMDWLCDVLPDLNNCGELTLTGFVARTVSQALPEGAPPITPISVPHAFRPLRLFRRLALSAVRPPNQPEAEEDELAKERNHAFWRTLVANRDHRSNPIGNIEEFGSRNKNIDYRLTFVDTIQNRKFFVTAEEEGMGLGPWDTRPGDLVCLLPGSREPFMLRRCAPEKAERWRKRCAVKAATDQTKTECEKEMMKQGGGEGAGGDDEDSYCTLMGKCYCHGLMQGQAVPDIVSDKMKKKKFRLV
ncbi:hypothetical protein MMC11_008389 [Xylographa trunciseda]|nr:hypothetical protein [Xylographa trunciseda]